MAQQQGHIDFSAGQAPGSEELAGAPPLLVNFLPDALTPGWMRLAPGTSEWDGFDNDVDDDGVPTVASYGSEVIGISDFDGKLVYVTADRKIYAVEAPGLVTALSTSTASTKLDGVSRPVFAKTESRILIAGGGLLSYWAPGSPTAAQVSSGPLASFVCANSQRLVATPTGVSGAFDWTNRFEANHLTGWDAFNFAYADARPDRAVAVFENSNEIAVFGTQTVQVFAPDANVAYALISTTNVGTLSPYSVINLLDEKSYAWFSNAKELVIGDGRSAPTKLLDDRVLKGIETYDDCIGWRVRMGNWDLLVWKFPTEERTFVIELKSKKWLELRGYDTTIGDWSVYPVTAYHYWEDEDVHLVGLADGTIAKLDPDAVTMAGQPIVAEAITGTIDRGTRSLRKQTIQLTVPLRRGVAPFGTTAQPNIEIRRRDDMGAWSNPIPIGLGVAGDYRPQVSRRIVSRPYWTTQWKLRASTSYSVSLGPVEELFETLGG